MERSLSCLLLVVEGRNDDRIIYCWQALSSYTQKCLLQFFWRVLKWLKLWRRLKEALAADLLGIGVVFLGFLSSLLSSGFKIYDIHGAAFRNLYKHRRPRNDIIKVLMTPPRTAPHHFQRTNDDEYDNTLWQNEKIVLGYLQPPFMISNAHYRYDHGMDNISLYTQTENQRRGMHMNICWDWNVNVVSKYNRAIFAIPLQHPHTSIQHNLGKTVNSSLESVGRICLRGKTSSGRLTFQPLSAAAFSPWRPNPNPPNRAPGAVLLAGSRGLPEPLVFSRESPSGCLDDSDGDFDRFFSVTISQAVVAIRVWGVLW